jgi:hypothetical protein
MWTKRTRAIQNSHPLPLSWLFPKLTNALMVSGTSPTVQNRKSTMGTGGNYGLRGEPRVSQALLGHGPGPIRSRPSPQADKSPAMGQGMLGPRAVSFPSQMNQKQLHQMMYRIALEQRQHMGMKDT